MQIEIPDSTVQLYEPIARKRGLTVAKEINITLLGVILENLAREVKQQSKGDIRND